MKLGNRKLQATTGFVLVESKEHESGEQVTKSGIVLPQKEKHNEWVKGRIHSAGRFAKYGEKHRVTDTFDAPVKEGDMIMYKKYEGEKIRFDDITLYRLPYERVRMTLKEVDN